MAPDPDPPTLEERVIALEHGAALLSERTGVLSERLDRYWSQAQEYVGESRADRERIHRLLQEPRRTQALLDREGILAAAAAIYVRQDLYESRHRELTSELDTMRSTQARDQLALTGLVTGLTDRVITLEKGSAALIARWAVIGGLAIMVLATVISVAVDKLAR